MRFHLHARAAILAYAVGTFSALGTPAKALAAAQDYRFEAAGPPAKSGKATIVKIRLVHLPDSKPVSGAVIFQTRFDMGPDGMASMTAPVNTPHLRSWTLSPKSFKAILMTNESALAT